MLHCFKKDNSANDTADEIYTGVVLRLLQPFTYVYNINGLKDLEPAILT